MPRTHRQPARGDPLKPLYDRLYARTDLRGSGLHLRLVLVVGAVWLLCGVLNFTVLGRAFLQPRERAVLAFGYGPAFVPLGLMQPRSTIAIASKRIPVRAGAQLVGGSVLLLCMLPLLMGGEASTPSRALAAPGTQTCGPTRAAAAARDSQPATTRWARFAAGTRPRGGDRHAVRC